MAIVELDVVAVDSDDAVDGIDSVDEALAELITTARAATSAAESLGSSVSGVGRESGGASGGVSDFASSLDPIAAIAKGAAVALAAMGAAAVGIASLALSASQARRGFTDLYGSLLGSERAGQGVYAAVEALSGTLPITSSQAHEWAGSLLAAGVSSSKLEASIRTLATAQAALGPSGKAAADSLERILKHASASGAFKVEARQLAEAGVTIPELAQALADKTGASVKDMQRQLEAGKIGVDQGIDALNAVVEKKFGAAAAKRMLDLDVQTAKLKDNFHKLFEGADPSKALGGLKQILDIFDKTTPAGKALATVFTTLAKALFGAGGDAAPVLANALKRGIILLLQTYAAVVPIAIKVRDLAKEWKAFADRIGASAAIITGIKVVFVALGVAIGVVVAVGAAIIAWAVALGVAFYALVGAVEDGVVAAFKQMKDEFNAAMKWLDDKVQAFEDLGGAIVDGLVSGLTGGIKRIGDAAKGLGDAAKSGIKDALGIASPSKEARWSGQMVGEGKVQGLEDSRSRVKAAGARLGAAAGDGLSSGGKSGGGAGGMVLNGGVNVTVNGSGLSASDLQKVVVAATIDALEEIMGGASTVAPAGSGA